MIILTVGKRNGCLAEIKKTGIAYAKGEDIDESIFALCLMIRM